MCRSPEKRDCQRSILSPSSKAMPNRLSDAHNLCIPIHFAYAPAAEFGQDIAQMFLISDGLLGYDSWSGRPSSSLQAVRNERFFQFGVLSMATAQQQAFHPLPVIGYPETYYAKHIHQADKAGD